MMERLSAEEFDRNYERVSARLEAALKKSGRDRGEVTLLAATKTVDPETINYAIGKGITLIGENRVQELLAKADHLVPVKQHFIGHLQTNKVKDVIDKVEMIESVGSLKLAEEIEKQAARRERTMDILLEVNIGGEESKSGFAPDALFEAFETVKKLPHLRVCGLMAIPPITPTPEDARKYFRKMYQLFIDMRGKNIDNGNISVLSMGMSGDFEIAIEEGATLVRVGTSLFGKRLYQ